MVEEQKAYPAAFANSPKIRFFYEGTLDDGSVFDSNIGGNPAEACIGHHDVIPGLEDALAEMEVGEKREVTVPPERAYGQRSEKNVQLTNLDLFKNGDEVTLEEGARVRVKSPKFAFPVEGTVGTMYERFVQIDFNHPLAGKTLHFNVEVVDRFV